MNRAYSTIEIKAVEDAGGKRTFKGIASTPSTDRMGDIVEPEGVEYELPIPFLWQHDSGQPIGWINKVKVSGKKIEVEGEVHNETAPGKLKDRLDECWQTLKAGLVRGLSIGFNSIESARIDGTYGMRFVKWLWLELSAVTIAANQDASITAIKSLCEQHLAALGQQGSPPTDRNRPGASGQSSKPPSGGFSFSRSQKGLNVKTLSELRELRTTKNARVKELAELFQQDGHETTDEEATEYDGLLTEIKSLDTDIRVAQYHAMNAGAAKAVDGSNSERGSASRGGLGFVRKTDPDDKFKGQSMTRLAIAKAAAFVAMKQGNYVTPAEFAERRWGKSHPNLVRYIKAAVAGGGTDSGEWGAELAQSDTRYNGDFVEFLYGLTVFDALPLREIPANVHIKGQDGAATGYWVGQSKAIPVSKPDFSSVELRALKVGAISVCSRELIEDSSPSAELYIRDSIGQASAQRIDTTFLSATAASAGVSPAGILNGVTALFSSGPTAAELRDDIMSLYASFITAKNASGLVLVTTPSLAKATSLMVNALGQTEFPGLNANGGMLLGDKVYTGDNVGAGDLILLSPKDIWKIGDSGLEFSMSDSAMVEQDSAPQGATDTPVAASATMVSLWQEDSIGFKVTRRINWGKRRADAVAYVGDAAYGAGT